MVINPGFPDLNFRLLQLEFSRLDIILHRQVERVQASAPKETEEISPHSFGIHDAEAFELLQRPFGNTVPHLSTENEYADALMEIESAIAEVVALAESNNQRLRLQALTELLGLDAFARDIFIIALAPAFDTRYSALYAYLQDDLTHKWPTVNLILDLLGPPEADRLMKLSYFVEDSPLWRHRLLASVQNPANSHPALLSQMVRASEEIANWLLLGQYQPPLALRNLLAYTAEPHADTAMLAPEQQQRIADTAEQDVIFVLYGIDSAGQTTTAHSLAVQSRKPLLTLDLTAVSQVGPTVLDAVKLCLRDALLTSAIPFITGWDSCLIDGFPPPALVREISAFPGLVIIAGLEQWQPRQTGWRRRVKQLGFPGPEYTQREQLLHYYLEPYAAEIGMRVADLDVGTLARQFQLTTHQVEDTIQTAVDLAAQDNEPLDNHHLFTAARLHTTARLTSMASKITPRYSWTDLILPDEQVKMLREMVDTVRYRSQVLDEWQARKKLVSSNGITSLFVGSPGTGKTMAAEVMAGELEMDLYKIDLSGLVSKYIGETEKNLERVFSEADRSNAILFFDEADSIFGKRSEVKDARDRYANIEISYLLQRMESYNGVTILATNLGSNLDEAFTRRLQFRVNFPDPDVEQRLRIWQTLFPARVPKAVDLDWVWLAQKFNLTGGNIRNVIVAAAYLAASDGGMVTMPHLLHAIRREMQKMGRMINEKDFNFSKP